MRWLATILLAPILLQAPSGPTPVTGQPSISLQTVQNVLAAAHSPLAAIAQDIYSLGQQANIDPAFALAIWTHESSLDTAGASVRHNNPGNLICQAAAHPPALPCVAGDRWAQYPDLRSAVADWYRYLTARYVQQGLTTVEAILPIYAPPSENDTAAYIQQVIGLMRQWGSTTVGTGPATQPSWAGGIIDSWVNAPLDAIQFRAIRSVAVAIWTALRSGFAVILLLERLRRLLLTSGFQPVIAAVATEVGGILPSLMTLAAGLAALSFILRPVGRLRLSDLRTVIALCLLLPIGLPLASAGFQQLEGLRSDMAGALYDRAWQVTNAQGLLQGAATGGTLDQIGAVGPLDPAEGTARHGVDVAAAYVYAVASDILTPTHDLPVAFAAVYFPHPDTQRQGEAPTLRANDLHLAWMGVTRLAYGIGPVVFAFFESLTNLLWTLAGGFLFVAGVLSVVLCWFPPAQHIVYGVGQKFVEVVFTSWGASILQAVLMAFVFALAGAQSATLLLGACVVGLFLSLVFCWIAATTFYAAIGGVVTAVTAGGVRAQELERGATTARQQMAS